MKSFILNACCYTIDVKQIIYKKRKKMKNKKEKKKTNFNYSEEFITSIPNPTKQELKNIFNKKYFRLLTK